MADFRPDFLFTEERIEEGRAWQKELREKHGTVKVPVAVKALQAAARYTDATLQDIQSQLEAGNEEGLKFSYTRLAELLTEQGFFEEAHEAAVLGDDPYWVEHTAQLIKALARPDNEEHCDCPNFSKEKDSKTNQPIGNNYIAQRHYVNGAWLIEKKCNLCGESNIVPEK